MTDRIKAASISLILVALITGVKFFLYAISGSIAVLSEAWHSFSDIATTFLVLVSILRQRQKSVSGMGGIAATEVGEDRKTIGRQFFHWFGNVDSELKIAGIISLILLSVSLLILWRVIFAEPAAIERPLITGIIFIGLSLGSFFLYRFQDTIGREGNSAALRADSLHNRADMAVSLLTGVSLILYHFGYNIDRWVSVYIALFIFSFSSEMLVNVVVSITRGGRAGLVTDYHFADICRAVFQPDAYLRLIDPVLRHLSLSQPRKELLHRLPENLRIFRRWLVVSTIAVLALGCLKTMAYTVNIGEQALVLRFGRITGSDRPVGPGLHWKLPWPVDRVERFQTGNVFSLAVGNVADLDDPMIWRFDHGDTKTFISGDNNLFLPYLTIHYRIRNPRHYYLNYRTGSADNLLAYQAYHILSQTFAHTAYFDIALLERRQWTAAAERLLQEKLDEMEAGIEIVAFCLRDLHPPKDIAASYESVVAAYQDREQILNHARRYCSTKLPESRSKAHKMINDVTAEAVEHLKLAQGETQNFKLRLEGLKTGVDIGKRLLALEAAEKSLKGKKIVLVDPESGIDPKMVYWENHMFKEGQN